MVLTSYPSHMIYQSSFNDNRDILSQLYHYLHFDMPLGMRGIPLVVTIHDLYPLTVDGYCSLSKRCFFRHVTRANTRRASRVIAISEHTKRDLMEHLDVPSEKIVVIPQNHSDSYRPIDDSALLEEVRTRYDLPARFILYTGNHKSHKNLARLIRAYGRLPAGLQGEFKLVLTGRPDGRARQLQRIAADLGLSDSVKFIGWVDPADLPMLYNLSSLAVLPSIYEGFGLLPLEAMACGVPVACSDATAIPEVVGRAGRLFDPYDIDSICSTIELALEQDLGNVEVRRGCLEQASRFSQEATADMTWRVYELVAGEISSL